MGFRALRVINDDVVKPAAGFPTHGHRDMEIVTYVIRGALAHKDSTGGEGVLRRGDVQTMSAGKGVRHSEFNPSPDEDLRLLQIWIVPEAGNLPPRYEQKNIPDAEKRNTLRLIVGPQGATDLFIHQDARVYASLLDAEVSVTHVLEKGRGAWVQMVAGELDLNGMTLKSGDGAAVEAVEDLRFQAVQDSEFLLFDL